MFNSIDNKQLAHKLFSSPMSKLYIYETGLNFVKSFIGLFVPLYLYNLGISLENILIFVIISSSIYLSLIPSSIKLIRKIGFKNMVLLSTPFYLLFIISINFVKDSILILYFSGILMGFYLSTFWPAFHSEIASNSDKRKLSEQIEIFHVLTIVVSSFAPLLGGFLLEKFSFLVLVFFSFIILCISSIPFIYSKDIKVKKFYFSFSKIKYLLNKYHSSSERRVFSSEGIDSLTVGILFPIFLFLILDHDFFYVGTLSTVISILSLIFFLGFREQISKLNKKKSLAVSSKILSLGWIVKVFFLILNSPKIIFIDIGNKIVGHFFLIKYFDIFYNNVKKKNLLEYIVVREMYFYSTKIIVSIFAIILLQFFKFQILYLLILLSFITVLLKSKIREY